MLVIHTRRRLPALVLLGLLVMVIGGVMDVIIHVGAAGHGPHADHETEHLAHLVGIAGMSLVLAGVVLFGACRHRRPRAARSGGLESNAHR